VISNIQDPVVMVGYDTGMQTSISECGSSPEIDPGAKHNTHVSEACVRVRVFAALYLGLCQKAGAYWRHCTALEEALITPPTHPTPSGSSMMDDRDSATTATAYALRTRNLAVAPTGCGMGEDGCDRHASLTKSVAIVALPLALSVSPGRQGESESARGTPRTKARA